MKQNFDVTKYDAQIINYIKKTVHNTAINYFVKNSRIEEAEVISGQKFLDFLIEDKTFFVKEKSSPDSCVKCYTMFLPFLLIKIDVFS